MLAPRFVTENVWVVAMSPMLVSGNVSEPGSTEICAPFAPVPNSEACTVPPGLAATETVATALPRFVGLKRTWMTHVPSGASAAVQPLASENWSALVPPSVTAGVPVGVPPALVIVKLWNALCEPRPTVP